MKNLVMTCFGMLLAIVAASPSFGQTIYQFDGGGVPADDFFVAANWNDFLAGPDAVPGPLDQAVINDGFTVTHGSPSTATSVSSLVVGADWPVTGSTLGTAGTLNVTEGSIAVTGAGNAFTVARACCQTVGPGTSAVNLSGSASLSIDGTDPTVGARDVGELSLSGTSAVTSPNSYWRFGNYGHLEDPFDPLGGLQGEGYLNVSDNASFSGMFVFLGDNSSVGEISISDSGSVTLAQNLVNRPSGTKTLGSATVRMNGSSATFSVGNNIESSSDAGEIPSLWEFNADAGGVSAITVQDAINITGNDLIVNLNGYNLANFESLLLFDGDQALVGDRVFGTFASSVVNGSVIPHTVIYDQANGDIYVQRIPEPSTMLLMGLGMVMAISTRRRENR
jgi:hypothetical protein